MVITAECLLKLLSVTRYPAERLRHFVIEDVHELESNQIEDLTKYYLHDRSDQRVI